MVSSGTGSSSRDGSGSGSGYRWDAVGWRRSVETVAFGSDGLRGVSAGDGIWYVLYMGVWLFVSWQFRFFF